MAELLIAGKAVQMTKRGNLLNMSNEEAEQMYSKKGKLSFEKFKEYSFPYVMFDEDKAKTELNALASRQCSDKSRSHIISSMHKSRYSCSRLNMMSPVEYWKHMKHESIDSWKKFYINRLMNANIGKKDTYLKDGILSPNTIIAGFTVTHKADCPSYLKPMLAKRLVSTYLSKFDEVFCPLNGFSGIMLGTVVGNRKRFVGQDINANFIDESKQIRELLLNYDSSYDISLKQKDIFDDNGEYQCFFACPPYLHKKCQNIEKWNFDNNGKCIDKSLTCDEWIDECISRYKCKKYLFVVDDKTTIKHKNKVVETLTNRSHFGRNYEYVVLI